MAASSLDITVSKSALTLNIFLNLDRKNKVIGKDKHRQR